MKLDAVRRFLRDTSGHFAIMTAIMAPVALTLAAFAVDAGALYTEKRRAQALADLAAISAAGNLADPERAALATLTGNGVGGAVLAHIRQDGEPDFANGEGDDQIMVEAGRYLPDAASPSSSRFASGRFAAGAPVNAVKVTYRTIGTRYFSGSIIPPPEIVVHGTAAVDSRAAFSVGSRLAALNGGLVNSLLGGLTGSSLSLSVMDYNALLSADVDLLQFLDVLAVDLDLTAATYDKVLDTKVTLGQVAGALGRTGSLPGAAKTALSALRQQASGGSAKKFTLSGLIDLGAVGGRVVGASVEQVAIEVGIMQLLSAGAVAAGNGRQVALDLGAGVPGLVRATVQLAIGEPPRSSAWLRYSERGGVVRTAQTRLKVVAEIGGGALGAIRLPLYLELAFAEARLGDVACPDGRAERASVKVEARPGVASLHLADINAAGLSDFASAIRTPPAELVAQPLVKVSAAAQAEIANTRFSSLTFKASEIGDGTIKRVSTTTPLTSLTSSLLSNLALDVQVAGLGLGLPSNVGGTVGALVSAATPALDTLLIGVLSTLGITIGEADVQVHGVSCGRPVLVQ